jgi:hypothetical protein
VRARLPVLLLCCGGLAWAAVEDGRAMRVSPPTPARSAIGQGARPAVPAVALPESPSGPWAEQVERPLFAPGRRPPAPAAPAAVAEAAPEPPPPLAANGVVLRLAGAVALLRLADERIVRAVEGDDVDGWTVAIIGAEGVRLSRGARVLDLPVRARAAEGVMRH